MNCACGNAARYVTADGRFTCAICPIKEGVDSIRLADVPALLRWARAFLGGPPPGELWEGTPGRLQAIIGKDVTR